MPGYQLRWFAGMTPVIRTLLLQLRALELVLIRLHHRRLSQLMLAPACLSLRLPKSPPA
jgi:hypothetical protein